MIEKAAFVFDVGRLIVEVKKASYCLTIVQTF